MQSSFPAALVAALVLSVTTLVVAPSTAGAAAIRSPQAAHIEWSGHVEAPMHARALPLGTLLRPAGRVGMRGAAALVGVGLTLAGSLFIATGVIMVVVAAIRIQNSIEGLGAAILAGVGVIALVAGVAFLAIGVIVLAATTKDSARPIAALSPARTPTMASWTPPGLAAHGAAPAASTLFRF